MFYFYFFGDEPSLRLAFFDCLRRRSTYLQYEYYRRRRSQAEHWKVQSKKAQVSTRDTHRCGPQVDERCVKTSKHRLGLLREFVLILFLIIIGPGEPCFLQALAVQPSAMVSFNYVTHPIITFSCPRSPDFSTFDTHLHPQSLQGNVSKWWWLPLANLLSGRKKPGRHPRHNLFATFNIIMASTFAGRVS